MNSTQVATSGQHFIYSFRAYRTHWLISMIVIADPAPVRWRHALASWRVKSDNSTADR